MKRSKKIAAGIAIVSILGFSSAAFSYGGYGNRGDGMGNGHQRGMGYGYQMGAEDGNCPGSGYGRHKGYGRHMGNGYDGPNARLDKEQIEKLNQERDGFFKDTRSLRDDIYQKRLELRSEMARQNPDAAKVKNIQKEMSNLESEFDQKRIDHRLKMRDIAPEAGRGFAGKPMGRNSGGRCW